MNELILDNRIMPVVLEAGNISGTCSSISGCISSLNDSLYIVIEGYFDIIENDVQYTLSPGSALFIKHGTDTRASFHHNENGCIIINYYYFDIPAKRDNYSGNQYIIPKLLENVSGSILFEKADRYIELFNSDSTYSRLDINARFFDILSECVKYSIDYRHNPNNLSENIIAFLNDHINEPLNTKDMEKRFFLTYKYMGTIFKRETGYTILNYHTLLRIESARKMLGSTLYSIDEISRRLGYSDPLYFSRVFKKNTGISPLAFRKQHIL